MGEEQQHIPLPLKYRPMTFEDVVGQEHVVKTIRHAIESNRVANAYLFIGSRGIGKTTMSRIFAKALNCLSPNGVEPCGECLNCKEIAAGHSLDVVELDAASHNSVEDVKPIIESVQFAPASSKYKIFIIDECHMLSKAAWNAMLKTLEEPPPWVRFVFATTEGDKVLSTIISRCQRFDLRRIQTNDIVSRLQYICKKEKIEAEEDALLAIARGAEGGMRDALSSLDQLISFKGNKVTEDDALNVFGLVSRSSLETLAGAILKGDTAQILSSIEMFDSAGKNMRKLAGELLMHFRNLVVYQALGGNSKSIEATSEQIKTLSLQSEGLDAGRVFKICDQLVDLQDKLRYALGVRALIEMTLLRAARLATTATVDELLKAVKMLREGAPLHEKTQKVSQSVSSIPTVKPATKIVSKPIAPKFESHTLPSVEELMAEEATKKEEEEKSKKPLVITRSDILNDPKINEVLMTNPGSAIIDIKEKNK